MRGSDEASGSLFSYIDLEKRVKTDHPLRLIRQIVDQVLASMEAKFDAAYPAKVGRPSIPPERLLRASLLQAFYSIRSERQLVEQIEFNMLFRWFVGLGLDDGVWDATTFTKNRDRLLSEEFATRLLTGICEHARVRQLLSRDQFSVDGTLIDAWASMKSFRLRDEDDDSGADSTGGGRNPSRNFSGQKRSNETHQSRTDGDAKLYRKGVGKESRLCYMGHALMENDAGLVVRTQLTEASGTAEREAALKMIRQVKPPSRRVSLGGDKGFDAKDFIGDLRKIKVTPHIAPNDYVTKTGKRRHSSIDRRTTRHPGFARSQRTRKRIEEVFGWIKQSAGLRQTKFRGRARVAAQFTFAACAYNLVRLPKLLVATS